MQMATCWPNFGCNFIVARENKTNINQRRRRSGEVKPEPKSLRNEKLIAQSSEVHFVIGCWAGRRQNFCNPL